MEMFLKKGAINRCSNLTLIFEILKFSITFNEKKSINSFGDMVYTPQFKHKNNQKASFKTVQKGAGCCMYPCEVISSVA